jgi:DnaJ like chaperone protein
MMKILLIILALLYLLSPYDLFPDFFAIGWGWLDDLIILGLLWRYLKSKSQRPYSYWSFFNRYETTDAVKDPYTILNIPRNAAPEEIKKAYRQLANKYHPDKVQHLGEDFKKLAEKRFKEIEEAYRELKPK